MALSGDQEALLSLIVVRGQNPDQVASILGIERAEVDTRIVSALETLAPGGPPLPAAVVLTLIGNADPISRADAASAIAADEDLGERVTRIRSSLGENFPRQAAAARPSGASRIPQPPVGKSPPGTATDEARSSTEGEPAKASRYTKLPDARQKRLLSILISAAGLMALVVVVVLVIGDRGEGDVEQAGPTEAILSPARGQTGRGAVEFGFAGSSFAANLSFTGLEPNRGNESYALWLDGPVGAFPVERVRVGAQGVAAGQAVLNEAIICFIAADLFTDLELSRTRDSDFRDALSQAVRARGGSGSFPQYVGQTVLSGPIEMPRGTKDALIKGCGGRVPQGGSQGS